MLRILHGALEGTEVDGIIPLESNIDWLNGVVFDKGCYLGQELTARTHYRGLLRKRCFPIVFANNSDENIALPALALSPGEAQDVAYGTVATDAKTGIVYGGESVPRGTNILNEGKKRAGKLMTERSTLFNVGIAMLRLEHVLGVAEDGGKENAELPERLLTTATSESSTSTLVGRPVIWRE
jgi:folate-binding protein YgfZ